MNWFRRTEREDSGWANRVKDIQVNNFPLSPCTLCARELAEFAAQRPQLRPALLFWQTPYVMTPQPGEPDISSTPGALAQMEAAGWILQPASSAVSSPAASGGSGTNLCASAHLPQALQAAGSGSGGGTT
jgi:hypothetical protein